MMKSLLLTLVLPLTGVGTASSQSELSTYITQWDDRIDSHLQ
ncbi:hypothetical protein P4S72_16240 [Vibrio sp. PP-XX7]